MDEGGGNRKRFKRVETVDTRCCANEEKIELTTNKKKSIGAIIRMHIYEWSDFGKF